MVHGFQSDLTLKRLGSLIHLISSWWPNICSQPLKYIWSYELIYSMTGLRSLKNESIEYTEVLHSERKIDNEITLNHMNEIIWQNTYNKIQKYM